MTDASEATAAQTSHMPSVAALTAEEDRLALPHFNDMTALALGTVLVGMAQSDSLAVVINIRSANRTLFHAALPGSSALHETWARRKSNTALFYQKASLLVGTMMREKGSGLSQDGLAEADFADHGGAVPIRVTGVGVVAVVTVSGLPQREDHAMAVRALETLLASL